MTRPGWSPFTLFGSKARGAFISTTAMRADVHPISFHLKSTALEMEHDSEGPILKVLLLIGGNSSAMGSPKRLLQRPDGQLAFEQTLNTLHCTVPSAPTIYVSLQDIIQLANIEPALKDITVRHAVDAEHQEHDDHRPNFSACCPVVNRQDEDIGPAAGPLNAHSMHPESTWLVLSCDYPLLPPSALQQLIVEYQYPVTCLVIGIGGTGALEKLKENGRIGSNVLHVVVEEMKGKLVKTLQEEWLTPTNTREE
jgi:molybdopterin-guanine dinucleotide biosynthesis protein A